MRWAFWRRNRSSAQAAPLPVTPEATARRAPEATARRAPAAADEPDEDRHPHPAFSGASPEPGGDAPVLLAQGGGNLADLLSAAADPARDASDVRAAVLALVRAAIGRDRSAAAELLRQLDARGEDELALTAVAAMAALGDRLAVAADVPKGDAAAVVAQGDTVAARAEPLLRAVAPDAPRALVRRTVRSACGVREQDQDGRDAPPGDLALVAAVLLAQTVLDGPGDAQALADELAALLPDRGAAGLPD